MRVRCWHCRSFVRIAPRDVGYWRCGACRRINGRPKSARGFSRGFLRCGLCRFYASRLIHLFAIFLILLVIGAGLFWALPLVTETYSFRAKCVAWFASISLSLNALAHFAAAARRDPGSLPKLSREEWIQLVQSKDVPWCDICDNLKPPRAHHCSTCSTCVVDMDHHCVFLHNCVGANNMKYFVRFLGAVVAGTAFVATYTLIVVLFSIRSGSSDLLRGKAPKSMFEMFPYLSSTRDGKLFLLFGLSLGILIAVSVLFASTCYSLMSGETYLEKSARLARNGPDYRKHKRRPYDDPQAIADDVRQCLNDQKEAELSSTIQRRYPRSPPAQRDDNDRHSD